MKEKLELLYKKCDLDINGNEVINASVLKKIKVNQSKTKFSPPRKMLFVLKNAEVFPNEEAALSWQYL